MSDARTPEQIPDVLTQYGFTWGPMEVLRACADARYRTIIVRTKHRELQIHVSPTGRAIRTYQHKAPK